MFLVYFLITVFIGKLLTVVESFRRFLCKLINVHSEYSFHCKHSNLSVKTSAMSMCTAYVCYVHLHNCFAFVLVVI